VSDVASRQFSAEQAAFVKWTVKRRRVIKALDGRYVIPDEIDPVRVLFVTQVANNDGGTGWHYEYHVLCEEVDS
jgi:hypothetical protein